MLSRLAVAMFVTLAAVSAPAAARASEKVSAVAVFPVENLTGRIIPADQIRQLFIERLAAEGVLVLADEALDEFMTRHRVRYAAGIDGPTGRSLRDETEVDTVLIASVELYGDAFPPKFAMMARLVSVDEVPTVIWAEDAGLSGDEAPGLLDLSLVTDFQTIFDRGFHRVAESLAAFVRTGERRSDPKSAPKFRPKSAFHGLQLEQGKVYSIAVLPFFNVSDRQDAGEILALLFMRHLSGFAAFRVIDAGAVRQQLLQARVVMTGGVSITDAELVGDLLDADLIVGGRALSYEDYEGADGRTRVEFSTVVIDRHSRKVVWSSDSYNDGGDGVRFFGRGRSTTAHAMATQMVQLVAEPLAGGRR